MDMNALHDGECKDDEQEWEFEHGWYHWHSWCCWCCWHSLCWWCSLHRWLDTILLSKMQLQWRVWCCLISFLIIVRSSHKLMNMSHFDWIRINMRWINMNNSARMLNFEQLTWVMMQIISCVQTNCFGTNRYKLSLCLPKNFRKKFWCFVHEFLMNILWKSNKVHDRLKRYKCFGASHFFD